MASRKGGKRTRPSGRKKQDELPVDLPSDQSSGKIPAKAIPLVLKAVELIMLAAIYSPISQLSLSPVYGSIPSLLYHSNVTIGALMLAWTTKYILRVHLPKSISDSIPLLACSVPTIQFYLFAYSGKLGPIYGPLVTELLTYFPLIFLSTYLAMDSLDMIYPSNGNERVRKASLGVTSYFIFSTTQTASRCWIVRNVGSSLLVSRTGLQFVIATFYAILLPSKLLLLASLPILHSASLNVHAPLQVTSSALNSTLQAYGYSLIARRESLTGYISVLDNTKDGFRVMRCDHSLLGGEWIQAPNGYQQKVKEPIYSVFAMLEAVRLVEIDVSQKQIIHPDDQTTALVMWGFSHFLSSDIIAYE